MSDEYALFSLILLGSVAFGLSPYIVAWIVARRAKLSDPIKFSIASCILAFGASASLFLLQLPLSLLATHLAPEWASQGFKGLGHFIIAADRYIELAVLVIAIALVFVAPLWLRTYWHPLLAAVRANSSFKPKPLRGSA